MNQVTFADAVRTIQDMFPGFDPDLIAALLQQNGNHIERTIEQVLQMAGEDAGGGTDSSNNSASTAPRAAAGEPTSAPSQQVRRPAPRQQQQQQPISVFQNVGSGITGGRGSSVVLPENFLRPPGWRDGSSNDSLT